MFTDSQIERGNQTLKAMIGDAGELVSTDYRSDGFTAVFTTELAALRCYARCMGKSGMRSKDCVVSPTGDRTAWYVSIRPRY